MLKHTASKLNRSQLGKNAPQPGPQPGYKPQPGRNLGRNLN